MDGPSISPAKKSQVRPYGKKSPFSRADVKAIRDRLKVGSRDRCLFELAICSALRAGDFLAYGWVTSRMDRALSVPGLIWASKRPARECWSIYRHPRKRLWRSTSRPPELLKRHLFTAHRRRLAKPLTVEGFRQLVKTWADVAGHQDLSRFAAHSTRRTLASVIYSETRDIAAVRHILGHGSTAATSHYLGVDRDAALELARKHAL